MMTRSMRLILAAAALLAGLGACTTTRLLSVDFGESIKAGDPHVAFKLLDEQENLVTSEALIADGPAVVVFYRGAWCPWCRNQLGELSHELDAFTARGVRVVGISTDSQADSRGLIARLGLKFQLLEDPDGMLARDYSGVEEDGTTIPGVFIIGQDGSLLFAHHGVSADDRVHARQLLAVIDEAAPVEGAVPRLKGGFRPLERVQLPISAAIASAQHGRDAKPILAGEVGVSALFPLGRYLLVGPATRMVLSAAPVVDVGIATKLRIPFADDLMEAYLTPQFGLSFPLKGDKSVGWHAGAYLGNQLALNPDWAMSLQMGLIYERMDGLPRRDGFRFSVEFVLTLLL